MYFPGYHEFCCRVNLVAGVDALEKIPSLLEDLGVSRPMILTDKGVRAAGLIDLLLQAFQNRVTVGTICDEVPMDSDVGLVNRLAGLYRGSGCDGIVAVGGGSVLDTAKGVDVLVSENALDLMDFEGAGILKRRLRPLIAVPTTAGTGSEMTLVAVISDPATHKKHLFLSHFLQPHAAVLDPRMTLGLPALITAQTGMDALCHAVEAYTCLGKNPLSDGAALAAVELIGRHLLQVVRRPEDWRGRLAMASAATLAGAAFSNSMTGMAHALGHALGGLCGVPHGVAATPRHPSCIFELLVVCCARASPKE